MNILKGPSIKSVALWIAATSVGQALKLLISIASTIVLARLLVPGDFGLMATCAPIMGFVDLLRDAGLSQALVQRNEVSDEQSHALFWLMMGISAILGLMVVSASPLLAAAFHEPRLPAVLIVAALLMQVSSFGSQAFAWLNRNTRFNAMTAIDVIASVLSFVTASVVALTFRNYWALVSAGVAGTFVSVGLAVWISGWRPGRPRFDRVVLQMARFGAGVSLFNLTNFFSYNADNLLIARYIGPVPLGYYDRAYKLMLMPLSQVTWPISRVLTPVLSRLQDRTDQYVKTYLTSITLIMVCAQPAIITATVLAKPTVLLLLGEKWAPSIPIFQWLSAAAIHQVVTSSHGWLYLSQGRGRHYAIVGIFGAVTTVAAFLIGLQWGVVGIAVAYTINDYALRFPFSWLYVGRAGPVRTRLLLNMLWPHILAAGAATAGLLTYDFYVEPTNVLELGLAVMVSYTCYCAALMIVPEKRRLAVSGFTRATRRSDPMSVTPAASG